MDLDAGLIGVCGTAFGGVLMYLVKPLIDGRNQRALAAASAAEASKRENIARLEQLEAKLHDEELQLHDLAHANGVLTEKVSERDRLLEGWEAYASDLESQFREAGGRLSTLHHSRPDGSAPRSYVRAPTPPKGRVLRDDLRAPTMPGDTRRDRPPPPGTRPQGEDTGQHRLPITKKDE